MRGVGAQTPCAVGNLCVTFDFFKTLLLTGSLTGNIASIYFRCYMYYILNHYNKVEKNVIKKIVRRKMYLQDCTLLINTMLLHHLFRRRIICLSAPVIHRCCRI